MHVCTRLPHMRTCLLHGVWFVSPSLHGCAHTHTLKRANSRTHARGAVMETSIKVCTQKVSYEEAREKESYVCVTRPQSCPLLVLLTATMAESTVAPHLLPVLQPHPSRCYRPRILLRFCLAHHTPRHASVSPTTRHATHGSQYSSSPCVSSEGLRTSLPVHPLVLFCVSIGFMSSPPIPAHLAHHSACSHRPSQPGAPSWNLSSMKSCCCCCCCCCCCSTTG